MSFGTGGWGGNLIGQWGRTCNNSLLQRKAHKLALTRPARRHRVYRGTWGGWCVSQVFTPPPPCVRVLCLLARSSYLWAQECFSTRVGDEEKPRRRQRTGVRPRTQAGAEWTPGRYWSSRIVPLFVCRLI